MQFDYSHVFFTGTLLGLNQSGGIVDADNEAASDFGVKSARVASLVYFEDLLNPGDHLVRRWVGWLVQIDHSISLVHVNGARCGRVPAWKRSEVTCLHIELVKILYTKIIDRNTQINNDVNKGKWCQE